MISTVVLSTIISLSSCNSNQDNNTQSSATEQAAPEHNHEGHDHSAHQQQATSQAQSIEELAQKAPSEFIPAFKFYKVKSGISFTNVDIPTDKKTVFILFDPSCGHCQVEASHLSQNYDKLKDVNLYFISMNDPALMANFLETFGKNLVGKPNVEVLYDRNQDFIQKIHIPSQFPANYVYSKDGKIQSYWEGDKDITDIIAEYTK